MHIYVYVHDGAELHRCIMVLIPLTIMPLYVYMKGLEPEWSNQIKKLPPPKHETKIIP